MNQIEELQGRIQAALERIGAGTRALEAARAAEVARAAETAVSNGAGNAELEQELEEERLANAQLEERLKLLNARLKEAEGKAGGGSGSEMAALQAELQLLRNEAGDPAEKQALRAEVKRLKAEMEAAANGAASEREALEDRLAEAQAENSDLKRQIEELSAAVGTAGGNGAPDAEVAALREQLETAESALAQAQQQVQAAQAGDSELAAASRQDVDAELARQNEMLIRLDSELQQLRQANEELRASNTALRAANAEGVGDASLINASMEAEIEGLRAAQASDQAQVNAVLAKLEPLLANARNLPEGEEV
ncbi:colicin transporter [Cribrihabitans neustonicus]|uniref:colicin transporter n=1 Tax=Cribrihabitans neustonicus TaxID=1429085 RepID=UPI003B5B3659